MNTKIITGDYDNMKPLLNLALFLGLGSNKIPKLWHIIYSILILTSINVCGIINMYTNFYKNATLTISTCVIRIISTIAVLLFINTFIIMFSVSTRYKCKYNKFLDTFSNFPIKRRYYIWIQILTFHLLYGLYIIDNIRIVIFLREYNYLSIYILIIILNYLLSISCLVMVNYIILLKVRFEVINKRLKSIFLVNLEKTVFIVNCKNVQVPQNDGSNSVKNIRSSYTSLTRAVKWFNQLFGVPILILYFYIFTGILDCVNILINGIMTNDNNSLWIHMLTSILLGVGHLLIMGIIVAIICDMTTKEAQCTATVCDNLLLDVPTISNNVQDRILKKELILLAQQATHHYPYFSAAGFFNVDYSLLLGMLGTVTSYVIVLIQIN